MNRSKRRAFIRKRRRNAGQYSVIARMPTDLVTGVNLWSKEDLEAGLKCQRSGNCRICRHEKADFVSGSRFEA
ncbi:MAG: hypothetical protein ABSB35_27235 [Bryobacteraceae bacterium]